MIKNMHKVEIDGETYIPLDSTIEDLARYLTNEMKDLPASQREGYEIARSDVLCHLSLYRYKAESDIEVRKPCINYEDGCEEWAGCPCVHFKARK